MAKRRRWQDLDARQRGFLVGLGTVQVALAVAAYRDLARRDQAQVRGSKLFWVFALLVNWIGPISYFVYGRRRDS